MLPSTCRHFPRLAVRDARGTFISLTHYCPTAAASLFRVDVPIEIVESPPAFPEAEYDGLVVKAGEWPPLLRPQMLTDLASGFQLQAYGRVCSQILLIRPELGAAHDSTAFRPS